MKIAFIGGRTFRHADGIATFMYHLATELVKSGEFEPIVFCESDRNEEEMVNGFKVIHRKSLNNPALTKFFLGLRATLHCIFKEKGVKIFHYNTWTPTMLCSHIPLLFGRKVIVQGHGLEWKRTKYSQKQQKFMKWCETYAARTNKHWTMCSQEQTDYFLTAYNRKCTTITCAVELPQTEAPKSDFLERFGLKGNDYFLYMGRLVQDKNPDFLIKGFLASGIKDKKLVFCGDGIKEYVQHLHELAGDSTNIIFCGSIFGADKDAAFRNCYVFCIPSTLEGLPMSLLEAMSYGKVALASDIPACHEALGESGIYVPYENAESISEKLQALNNNYKEYKWQEDSNKNRASKVFSWENTSKKYIAFVKSILNR